MLGIDLRKIETLNQLLTLAPHFGIAFLQLFVDLEIVPADYLTILANRQRKRIANHDVTLVVFLININAPDAKTLAVATAFDYLSMYDDINISALAE